MKNKKSIGIIIAAVLVLLVGIIGGTDSNENAVTTTDYTESIQSYRESTSVSEDVFQGAVEEFDVLSGSSVENTTASRVSGESTQKESSATTKAQSNTGNHRVALESIPAFSSKPYIVINNNVPGLSVSDRTSTYFEQYTPLDSLGRCGVAFACLGRETMPTEERGAIGSVKPSGWKTIKYDFVDGKYLYNRCHLIGFQLSAENANTRNLITGTRYMNVQGMLPFENMVADYIKETNNHVLYRVTPIFKGAELVCRGVQIEAYSVEDDGDGICFNVYCYNNQPGVTIDYSTGASELQKEDKTTKTYTTTEKYETTKENTTVETDESNLQKVWVTKSGKRYHSDRNCSGMKEPSSITIDEALDRGYTPCSKCG